MSLLDSVTSLSSGALGGDVTGLIEQAKQAITDGHAPESPVGKTIMEKVVSMLPAGTADVVEKIDQLIPDEWELKLGLTPEIKAFIKKAVSAHRDSL